MSSTDVIIEIQNICKDYHLKSGVIKRALNSISLSIKPGDSIAIFGPSGSGKSTLMNLLSGFDEPSSGTIVIKGTRFHNLNDNDRTVFRRNEIGYVHQSPYLLPYLTVLENVMIPLLAMGNSEQTSRPLAIHTLRLLGLGGRVNYYPDQMSIGQQQDVSIARALVGEPSILICDEPTGNLDRITRQDVLRSLKRTNEKDKITLIIATHSPTVAKICSKIYVLQNGELLENTGDNNDE